MSTQGIDVIKQYMVSLGFAVDNTKYAQFQSYLKQLTNTVSYQINGVKTTATIATGAIISAYGAVVAGTISLVTATAKADLGYQIFATRMWMAAGAAKNFKMSMDTMKEHSLEDIAWNPELRSQFFELEKLSGKMQGNTPKDMQGSMKQIRSLLFGFKELKVEVAYASQWISYYLTKYFEGPLRNIKTWFDKLNEKIITDMPIWTKKIADVLGNIIQFGASALRFLGDVFNGLKSLFDSMPKWAKIAAVGITAAFLILQSGPVGWIITAIGGIILLIDDFYAYMDGRKSSKTLAPIWKQLTEFMKGDGMKQLKADFELFATTLDNVAKGLKHVFDNMFKFFKLITGDVLGKKNIFDLLLLSLKPLEATLKLVLGFVNVLGLLMQNKNKEAASAAGDILQRLWDDISDPMNKKDDKGKKPGKTTAQNNALWNSIIPGNNGAGSGTVNQMQVSFNINAGNANAAEVANMVINKLGALQGIKDMRSIRDLSNPVGVG